MCGVIVALEGCLGMLDGSTGAGGGGGMVTCRCLLLACMYRLVLGLFAAVFFSEVIF